MTQVDTNKLKSIALRHYNSIPSTRGDTLESFLQLIFNWIAEWIADKQFRNNIKPGYCAFVLSSNIIADDLPEGAEEILYFKDDTTPNLGGNVYLTDYALNRVLRFTGDCHDLSDISYFLQNENVSDLPFVAFDVETQTIYVFINGGGELSYKFLLRADIPQPFTMDVFVEMLDDIYRQNLKYPEAYPPIWHAPKDRVPCKDTEVIIQSHLCCMLRARAQGSKKSSSESEWLTLVEEKHNAGRVDITIYQNQDCIVVSELKVLRYCHHPDSNKRDKKFAQAKTKKERETAYKPQKISARRNFLWAMHGARQAVRYKKSKAAQSAALVLYDMRDKDEDIPEVQDKCYANNVRYVRYYLYNALPD